MIKLKDVCDVDWGNTSLTKSAYVDNGEYLGVSAAGCDGRMDYYDFDAYTPVISAIGANCGRLFLPTEPFVAIKNTITLKPHDGLDGKYLYYALVNNRIPKRGGGQPFIGKGDTEEYKIIVPDLGTQLEIVELFDKINIIISCRKQEINKLNGLIKARFVEMFGDPVDNPKGWRMKKLQELVSDDCTISYGIVQTGDDQEEGIPVFRPVDIVDHVPTRSELKKTTEEISNKYKRTLLKGREMLITVRANIADTCIVGEEFVGCNVGRGIVPIRTNEDEMILEFLKHQIDSKHLNDNIKALAKGITLIQLNMEDLREISLIVPPIEQQKAYVEFAKQVDKSKSVVQKSLDKMQLLFDSLMQQYFG